MNTRLKCLLLDDELPGLSYLKLLCGQIPEIEVVKTFNDPERFLIDIPNLEFDFCILDIEMPSINGIQLATLLSEKLIIFTTAYKDYAATAFELDVVDYVLKPIKLERLQHAVDKVIKLQNNQKEITRFQRFNTNKGISLLHFNQLVYFRTSDIDSRDKTAFLADGTTLQLKNISFQKLLSVLPAGNFYRINKKEIIAMKCIRHYSTNQITTNIYLQPDRPLILTLGEAYRDGFYRKMNR